MYALQEKLLSKGHRLRPGGNFKKTSVTVHSTGNANSTVLNERKWLDNPTNKRDAAWHYIVGEGLVIQAIPDSEEAWHCGKKDGNIHSIAIELIESGKRSAVVDTAVELVVSILKERNWGVERIKQHYDWTGKDCPRIFRNETYIKYGLNWSVFLAQVKKRLSESGEGVKIDKIKAVIDGKEIAVERILVNDKNFVKLRDFAPHMGYNVSSKGSIPILTKKP